MLDQTLFIVSLGEGGFAKYRVLKHRRIPALVALPDFALVGQFEIAVGARQYVDAISEGNQRDIDRVDRVTGRICKTVLSLISLMQIKPFSYQLSL